MMRKNGILFLLVFVTLSSFATRTYAGRSVNLNFNALGYAVNREYAFGLDFGFWKEASLGLTLDGVTVLNVTAVTIGLDYKYWFRESLESSFFLEMAPSFGSALASSSTLVSYAVTQFAAIAGYWWFPTFVNVSAGVGTVYTSVDRVGSSLSGVVLLRAGIGF